MRTWTQMLALAGTLSLAACSGDGTFIPMPDTDVDSDTDTDSDTDEDTDSDTQCSPDEDQDGYCPPEDCDDTTIFVNPAWDEVPDDDIDNNCDGRIDEVFARVIAFENDALQGPAIIQIDPLGQFKGAFGLSQPAYVRTATLDRDLKKFIGWDGQRTVWRFDENGRFDKVAEIPEDYEWLDADEEADPPPGIGIDIAVHPDGFYLVAMADRLVRFDEGGSFQVVAQWACVEEDESHEFCPFAVTVDPLSGEALLLGRFGGVGTWHPDSGLTVITPSNPEEPGPNFSQAQHEPMDGSYAMARFVNEGGDPTFGIFKWNTRAQEMRLVGEWPADQLANDYTPNAFSIESERGDFYLTGNSASNGTGSWENQIWRMTADGSFTTQLFTTPNGQNDKNTWGAAVVVYDQD